MFISKKSYGIFNTQIKAFTKVGGWKNEQKNL